MRRPTSTGSHQILRRSARWPMSCLRSWIPLASAEPESRTRVGRLRSIPARCRIRKVRSPPWPTHLLILLIGMEIRAPGVDKGATLRAIVEETNSQRVIFAGDDLGDLPAFRAVRELGDDGVAGLLVCSASNEEDALTELSDVIVEGPRGLAAWLNQLADRLSSDSQ
jgi:hypothetical protein